MKNIKNFIKLQKKYRPQEIEPIIQEYWSKNNLFKVTENSFKKKYFCLPMFPYPSGKLHMGHVRNYTIADVIARYQRTIGKNVLHPIGWDAFGLPAENAALNNNISPYIWTYKNINLMKKQLIKLGYSYDWNRVVNTCKPDFYKWEQFFFILLYNNNYIYNKKKKINWCPYDKTVLANEQVINNRCWRCETYIKYKFISQWNIKIKYYANQLLYDLDKLSNWPKKVKIMQKNWINRLNGIYLIMPIIFFNYNLKLFFLNNYIGFKTNIKYIILSINHKFLLNIYYNKKIFYFIKNNNIFNKNIKYLNTGFFAINPITEVKIPIWINNINNNFIINIINKYYFKNLFYKINFNLHNWVISRQRYWGTPIPIIKFKKNFSIPIPINKLPVILPKRNINLKKKIKFNEKYFIKENDTFDTFIESSWYYLRYTNKKNFKNLINIKKANYWLPIDQYIGGIEHANMHLIYLRFFNKLLRDNGLIKYDEPVKKLTCQGMVISDTFFYINKYKNRVWISPTNVICINNIFYLKNIKKKLIHAGLQKMSKSKNNGINPDLIIEKYGADTVRLFIIFAAPPEMTLLWQASGLEGMHRFLNKIWGFTFKIIKLNNILNINNTYFNPLNNDLNILIHKVTFILNNTLNLNTAIASIMEFFNKLININININNYVFIKKTLLIILILLYPFIPHICFILFYALNKKNIYYFLWPEINNKNKNIFYSILLNGKFKFKLLINSLNIKKNIYISYYNKIIYNLIKFKIIKFILFNNKIINFISF